MNEKYQLCKRNKTTRKILYEGTEVYKDHNTLQILIDWWNVAHKNTDEEMYMREWIK